ncbi:SMP-30/gluconolactonase/LRE family protein [Rhodococcus sp. 24CO]|uniref:SMP-30/gluconolactonase/LRE family protein n=1 Tax=Rhodococcus sp. 24CO TaxID=3117460 RepID=UPI003D34C34C
MTNAVADAVAGARILEANEIAKGFSWPECPRWHDGALWFSDMYTSTIKTVDATGEVRTVVDATSRAADTTVPIVLGGFGWLPDGRMIVTSMHEKLVLVFDGASLEEYSDLSAHAPGPINDMVVDTDGRAYVTQLGFDLFNGAEPVAAPLISVEMDGSAAAIDSIGPLMGANGIALSEDGTRLYTAEAFANRLLVIDRAADGTLSNPREFAPAPFLPDGICLDSDGGVWAAMPGSGYVGRFVEGGEITDAIAIPLERGVGSACMLGGSDRSTLFVTVGVEVFDFEKSAREALASIWSAEVHHSGGGTRP